MGARPLGGWMAHLSGVRTLAGQLSEVQWRARRTSRLVRKNPRYTQRFAMHVGKLCRDMPNRAVGEMERLHHSMVKDRDKLYLQQQVDLVGLPTPRAIGIDEISIRKSHNYRVIVSDLERTRPI